MAEESGEPGRISEFVAHATIGPKAAKRIELNVPGTTALCEYQLQNSVDDGFVRLYTSLGHRYWVAQAQARHRCPDWKLHVSVELEDIPMAWDLVATLFLARRCTSAMKVVNLLNPPPKFMRGREITLYIYRYDRRFGAATFYDPVDSSNRKTFGVLFQQSQEYWLDLISEIERALEASGVRPKGLAEGDFRIGSCRYCSIRNEAFVKVPASVTQKLSAEEEAFQRSFQGRGTASGWSYPPNAMGYNAAGHSDPLRLGKPTLVFFFGGHLGRWNQPGAPWQLGLLFAPAVLLIVVATLNAERWL